MSSKRGTTLSPTDRARLRFSNLAQTSVSFRIGSFRAEMIYWGVIADRWWRNYLHAHPFFEVCYAFRGRGMFRINGEERRVQEGDLFLAKPRARHEVTSSRNDPLGIYFWAYSLTPTSTRMIAPADNVLDALFSAFIGVGEAVAHVGRHYERTLLMLAEEIGAAEPGHLQVIHALSLKLLLDTARAVVDTSRISETNAAMPMANGASEAVQNVLRYLQDNYSKPTEVRDVAAQVNLSERHVSRLFRQATGTSVLGYLTRLRMETACRLLLEDQLSIKQVARAVGYPDPHYFTTLFGRWMGVTPALYRRSGGAAVQNPAAHSRSTPDKMAASGDTRDLDA